MTAEDGYTDRVRQLELEQARQSGVINGQEKRLQKVESAVEMITDLRLVITRLQTQIAITWTLQVAQIIALVGLGYALWQKVAELLATIP